MTPHQTSVFEAASLTKNSAHHSTLSWGASRKLNLDQLFSILIREDM